MAINVNEIIAEKISDFFNRFCDAHNVQPSSVKLIIQLIDNSTLHLTPLYSVHSESIDKYCLLSEIIYLNMVERMAMPYSKINNIIGSFISNKASELEISCEKIKCMITFKSEMLIAVMFVGGKLHSQFTIEDLVKK